ncbi:hypothetical protein RHS01_03906 [Rhizoctonia solani]|uniref:Uncharacterized protein n=1 Tax=Rhizoctonia solani TaxID=456999 RepID=A0A8H7IGJ5_9AGAM|nr:hypothetical protein RHS01_03906 [Rhizoctonia solani]
MHAPTLQSPAPVPNAPTRCSSMTKTHTRQTQTHAPANWLAAPSAAFSPLPSLSIQTAAQPDRTHVPMPNNGSAQPISGPCRRRLPCCARSLPLERYGCTHTGPTRTSPPTCPKNARLKSLKPFLAITQSRIASLEHTVSSSNSNSTRPKNSLGPWFRPAGAPPSTEPSPRASSLDRSWAGDESRVRSTLPCSISTTRTALYLAQRRKRWEPTKGRERSSALRQAISGSTEPDQRPRPTSPWTQWFGLSRRVSGHGGTEAGSGRYHESLRMHEEVGSMRAIVHGLRMQVSALVMERNVAMMGRMRTSTAGSSTTTTERASSNTPERNEGERWATETRYYNQHPPPPVNLAVPYSIRRQETNNKL